MLTLTTIRLQVFEIRKCKRACMDDSKDLAFWPAYDSLNLDKEKQGVLDGSLTRYEQPVIWVELASLRSSGTQTDCWKVLKGILCSLSQQYAYLLTSFVETTIPTSIAHQAEASRRKPRRCILQHRAPSRLRRRCGRAHQSSPLQAQIPHDYGYVTCKVAIQHHSTSSISHVPTYTSQPLRTPPSLTCSPWTTRTAPASTYGANSSLPYPLK